MIAKHLKLAPLCCALLLAANVSAAPIDAVVTGVVTEGLIPGETYGELASYIGYSFKYEFSLELDIGNADDTEITDDRGIRYHFEDGPYYARTTLTDTLGNSTVWQDTDLVTTVFDNDADLTGLTIQGATLSGLYDILEFNGNSGNKEVVFFLIGSHTWLDNPTPNLADYLYTGAQLALDEEESFARVDTTSFSVATVPVPAAFWLFGSALAGLIGFKRR